MHSAMRLSEEAFNQLKHDLRIGESGLLDCYLTAAGRFPEYGWRNALLVAWQRPTATCIARENQWNGYGRVVNRGQEGITILAKRGDVDPDHPREAPDVTRRFVRFRSASVYDVAQTSGRSINLAEPLDPWHYVSRLRQAVISHGIALEYGAVRSEGVAESTFRRIRVLDGLPPTPEFVAVTRELAHQLLRGGQVERGPDRSTEWQAGAVALTVSQGVGLRPAITAHDLLPALQNDEVNLPETLWRLHHVSSEILRELIPEGRFERAAARNPMDTGREPDNGKDLPGWSR